MIKRISLFALLAAAFGVASCTGEYSWVKNGIDTAVYQLEYMDGAIAGQGKLPRGIIMDFDDGFIASQMGVPVDSMKLKHPDPDKVGQINLTKITGWTSGFYPGSLWIAGDITGDHGLWERAAHYTNLLEPLRSYKGTHDLGFMVWCSFGNALQLQPADSVKDIVSETAANLAGRFNPVIGCIRSWDFGKWNYPVIIDNMMNLELLFEVSKLTGDRSLYDTAVTHARTTMANHFRPDTTSYHVVSYNDDGTVESKGTHQGRSDSSAWSRGQAWGLYGYTVCYRETSDKAFLDQACAIADMVMRRVTTSDAIPYWDYDAPSLDGTPRDASAAAVTASALMELSESVPDGKKYFDYGEKILRSLSSPEYLAEKGTNSGFVLKHSVSSLPHGTEVDSPLSYADYYYLEGLRRYMKIKGISYKDL